MTQTNVHNRADAKELTFAITIEHEGEDWYLAKYEPATAKRNWPKAQWSSLPEDAMTSFETAHKADKLAKKVGGKVITREACPTCHGLLSKHPAISRIDNKTKICTRCGIKEALEDFEASK